MLPAHPAEALTTQEQQVIKARTPDTTKEPRASREVALLGLCARREQPCWHTTCSRVH